jgi:hypothetical protein
VRKIESFKKLDEKIARKLKFLRTNILGGQNDREMKSVSIGFMEHCVRVALCWYWKRSCEFL